MSAKSFAPVNQDSPETSDLGGSPMRRFALVPLLLSGVLVAPAFAQDSLPEGWTPGPTEGRLGDQATVSVPEGFFFLDAGSTRKFLEEGQNIPAGDEVGAILRPLPGGDHWFAIFSYDDTGHVDDSERDRIDARALMETLKEGNRRGNEERKRRGWMVLELEGWHQQPFYDASTNNLTWSTVVSSEGEKGINHSVRLLGRTGTMSAQLVAGADTVDAATTEFNNLLRGYAYNPGRRYSEFRQGDKLAGYGLTALIAGGVGAAAVKTGILQKFWKLIVLGLVAAAASLKGFFASLFGRREKTITEQYMQDQDGIQRE